MNLVLISSSTSCRVRGELATIELSPEHESQVAQYIDQTSILTIERSYI